MGCSSALQLLCPSAWPGIAAACSLVPRLSFQQTQAVKVRFCYWLVLVLISAQLIYLKALQSVQVHSAHTFDWAQRVPSTTLCGACIHIATALLPEHLSRQLCALLVVLPL